MTSSPDFRKGLPASTVAGGITTGLNSHLTLNTCLQVSFKDLSLSAIAFIPTTMHKIYNFNFIIVLLSDDLMLEGISDALGNALYDYYQTGNASIVVERSDGFVEVVCDLSYYFQGYATWPERQRLSLDYVRGRVLDIGTGSGRVAVHLQSKGFQVTAIDNSAKAVEVARLKGLNDVRLIPVEEINETLGDFDTVLMLGNNFGLMRNLSFAQNMLAKLESIVSKDGVLIIESHDPHATDDDVHLSYHRVNIAQDKLPGELTMRIRYKKFSTPWFTYLLASVNELEEILNGTSWKVLRILRDSSSRASYVGVLSRK